MAVATKLLEVRSAKFMKTLQDRLDSRYASGKGCRVTLKKRIGYTKEVILECAQHGLWQDAGPRILNNMSFTCPECAKQAVSDRLRDVGYTQFVDSWKERRNKNLRLLPDQEYADTNSLLHAECSIHGERVSFTPNNSRVKFQTALLCSRCRLAGKQETRLKRGTSWSLESLNASLMERDLGVRCLKFLGTRGLSQYQCTECEHTWNATGNILYKDVGCPRCVGNVVTLKDFLLRSKEKHGKQFDYTDTDFKSLNVPITVRCSEHEHYFEVLPRVHLRREDGGCVHCYDPAASKVQKRLAQYLESKGIKVDTNVRIGDGLDRKEIDIYLPEHKLAIEVNGAYWHSEQFKQDRYYHAQKTERMRAKGIRLLHFWDFELEKHPAVIGSMLRNAVGLSKNSIGARKCKVIEIPADEARLFLQTNHLGGFNAGSLYLGLRKDGELLALAVFGKPRFDTRAQTELIRFATKRGWNVSGAFSRLFRHARNKLSFSSCVSYADLRYSTGSVYEKNGFAIASTSSPSYCYVKGRQVLSRYQAQKKRLKKLLGEQFDTNLSETENMTLAGYRKIWDCGQQVWLWQIT